MHLQQLKVTPTKTDIFTEGNEGSIIKIDCWIKSSLKVPKL